MKKKLKLNSEKIYEQILKFTQEEQDEGETEVVELNLELFKTQMCRKEESHNHKHCMFYHNKNDRRREGCYYSSQICKRVEKGMECPEGDDCIYSHNYVEQLYRPIKYRTKFCDKFPFRLNDCEYSVFCSFAHQVKEIKVPLIHLLNKDRDFYLFHFKTVFCPFNQFEHDKSSCDYCHNWQDFRRPPQDHQYSGKECPFWQSQAFLMNYEDGCQHQFQCPHSHGWKEHEYHPLNYQVNPCQDYFHKHSCTKIPFCPHYHQQPALPHPLVITQLFQEVPINRNLPNPRLYHQYQQDTQQDPLHFYSSHPPSLQIHFQQLSPLHQQISHNDSLKSIHSFTKNNTQPTQNADEQKTMQQLSESLENMDLQKQKLYNCFIESD